MFTVCGKKDDGLFNAGCYVSMRQAINAARKLDRAIVTGCSNWTGNVSLEFENGIEINDMVY